MEEKKTLVELRHLLENGLSDEKIKDYFSNFKCKKDEDIDRVIKTLISKTFDMLFNSKGLKNIYWNHTCDWWFPNNLIQDNKIYFTNLFTFLLK